MPPASSAQPVTTPPLVTKVAKPAIGNVAASSLATRPSSAQTAPKSEPFAFADFTWLDGNARTKNLAFDTKFFTPEIRVDADYIYDFHHPKDDTIGGPSEVFRANEVHLTQLGVGGDFHFDNVRAPDDSIRTVFANHPAR